MPSSWMSQTWQVRKKIVANEEAHEDPIIDGTFKVETKGLSGNKHLGLEVLTQDRDAEPDIWFSIVLRGFLIKLA